MSIKSKNKQPIKALNGTTLGMPNYAEKFNENIASQNLANEKAKAEGYGFNLGENYGQLSQNDLYDIWADYENSEDFNLLSNKSKDARRKAFSNYLQNFKGSEIMGTPGLNAMESFKTDNQYYADLKNKALTDKQSKVDYDNLLGVIRVLGGYNAAGSKLKSLAAKSEVPKTEEAVPVGLTPEQIAQFKAQNVASDLYKFNPETLENDLNLFYANRFGKTLNGQTFSNPTSIGGYKQQIGDYLQNRGNQALSDYKTGYSSQELANITKAKLAYEDAINSGDENAVIVAMLNYGKALGENERDLRLGLVTNEDEMRNLLFQNQKTQIASEENPITPEEKPKVSVSQYTPESLSGWNSYTGPTFNVGDKQLTSEEVKALIADSNTPTDLVESLKEALNTSVSNGYDPLYRELVGKSNPLAMINEELYPGLYSTEGFEGVNVEDQQIFDVTPKFNTPENEQVALVKSADGGYKFVTFKDGILQPGVFDVNEITKKYKILDKDREGLKYGALRAPRNAKAAYKQPTTTPTNPNPTRPLGVEYVSDPISKASKLGLISLVMRAEGGNLGEDELMADPNDFKNRKAEKQQRKVNLGDITNEGIGNLSTEDYMELGALAANLASAGLAGKSLLGSTAVGAAATTANAVAKKRRGANWGDVALEAGIGYGLDALGAIPVLGQFAGISKAARAVKAAQKPILWALKSLGAAGLGAAGYATYKKIENGAWDQLDTNDFMLIGQGLKGIIKGNQSSKLKSLTTDKNAKTFTDKSGNTLTLSPKKMAALNKMKPARRAEALKAANTNNVDLVEAGLAQNTLRGKLPFIGDKFKQTHSPKLNPYTIKDQGTPAENTAAMNYINNLYKRMNNRLLTDLNSMKPAVHTGTPAPAVAPRSTSPTPTTGVMPGTSVRFQKGGTLGYDFSSTFKKSRELGHNYPNFQFDTNLENSITEFNNWSQNKGNEAKMRKTLSPLTFSRNAGPIKTYSTGETSPDKISFLEKIKSYQLGGTFQLPNISETWNKTMYPGINQLNLDYNTSGLTDQSFDNWKISQGNEAILKNQMSPLAGNLDTNPYESGITSPDKKPFLNKLKPFAGLLNNIDSLARVGQYIHSQKGTDALKKYTKVDTPNLQFTRTALRPVNEDLQQKQAFQDRIAQLRSIRSNSGDPNVNLATKLSAESQANQLHNNYNLARTQRLENLENKNLEIERINNAGIDQVANQNELQRTAARNQERQIEGILEQQKFQNTERAWNQVAQRAHQLKELGKQKQLLKLKYNNPEYQRLIGIIGNPNSTPQQKAQAQNELDTLNRNYELQVLDIRGK